MPGKINSLSPVKPELLELPKTDLNVDKLKKENTSNNNNRLWTSQSAYNVKPIAQLALVNLKSLEKGGVELNKFAIKGMEKITTSCPTTYFEYPSKTRDLSKNFESLISLKPLDFSETSAPATQSTKDPLHTFTSSLICGGLAQFNPFQPEKSEKLYYECLAKSNFSQPKISESRIKDEHCLLNKSIGKDVSTNLGSIQTELEYDDSPDLFRFPSRDEIISCLEKSPLINQYLVSKNEVEVVADFFPGGEIIAEDCIETEVEMALQCLPRKVPHLAYKDTLLNLVAALKKCARVEPRSNEKGSVIKKSE